MCEMTNEEEIWECVPSYARNPQLPQPPQPALQAHRLDHQPRLGAHAPNADVVYVLDRPTHSHAIPDAPRRGGGISRSNPPRL